MLGTLVVVVLKGRNLPNRRTLGKQDPFTVCRIGRTAHRTKVDVRGGQSPEWDDEIRFNLEDVSEHRTLKLSVFGNAPKEPDLIGDCVIPLASVLKLGETDNWYEIRYRNKFAGEIYMEMTFYSAEPPPAQQCRPASSCPPSPIPSRNARPLPRAPISGYARNGTTPSPLAQSTLVSSLPPTPPGEWRDECAISDFEADSSSVRSSSPRSWPSPATSFTSASSFPTRSSTSSPVHGSKSTLGHHANRSFAIERVNHSHGRLSLPGDSREMMARRMPWSPESFSAPEFTRPASTDNTTTLKQRPLPDPPNSITRHASVPSDLDKVHRGSSSGLDAYWVRDIREC